MFFIKVKPVGYLKDWGPLYLDVASICVISNEPEKSCAIHSAATNSPNLCGTAPFPAKVVIAAISGARSYIKRFEDSSALVLPMVAGDATGRQTLEGHWILDLTGADHKITLEYTPVELAGDQLHVPGAATIEIKNPHAIGARPGTKLPPHARPAGRLG